MELSNWTGLREMRCYFELAKNKLYLSHRREVRDKMAMYCVKCRAKREGKNHKKVTMKNKKPATKAVCEVCGTTMFRIGG